MQLQNIQICKYEQPFCCMIYKEMEMKNKHVVVRCYYSEGVKFTVLAPAKAPKSISARAVGTGARNGTYKRGRASA